MLFQFFRKKVPTDPVIKEQLEQSDVSRKQDQEALYEGLLREYPSPESAIEDRRKGYLTEDQLRTRFSPEEIDYIHKECSDRDTTDSQASTNVF